MARVLIADDSPALLAAAGKLLRDAGHEVTSTNSGGDALCLLRAKPGPDLMILDMVMPGFDGRQVLNELGPSAPPVIVITGDNLKSEDFQSGRVARVLTKPFDATTLIRAINDTLYPSMMETRKYGETELPPSPPMTQEQREKAIDRYKRANGGPAHATG
jgi:two-component system, NtrC family, response regulator GlrR